MINLTTMDDFLPKKEFNEIYSNIPFLEWAPATNYIDGVDHIWYSCGPLSPQDFSLFAKALKKKFNKKIISCKLNSWTWVNTKEPIPHVDYVKNKCEYQLIVYIRSDERISGGTAFYSRNEKGLNEIDIHIGFKENRAILFKSKDCLHSPLLWNSKSKTGRYSAIFQLVIEETN
jgi:hypothetical protein